jgi:hypothetical protein
MPALGSIRIAVVAALALFLVGARTADAALVAWGPATNISGDADVSTAGTLVGAFNIGAPGVPNTVVNGVNFAGLALTGNAASAGNFSFTTGGVGFGNANTLGSGAAPFSTLSAGYQTLLGSGAGQITTETFTLTMSGLTLGRTYQFEWWWNASADAPLLGITTAAAGPGDTVSLDPNTTNTEGGLG